MEKMIQCSYMEADASVDVLPGKRHVYYHRQPVCRIKCYYASHLGLEFRLAKLELPVYVNQKEKWTDHAQSIQHFMLPATG